MDRTHLAPPGDHRTMIGLAKAPFLYHRQPAKALYLTYFMLSALFMRVPYWLFAASVPALRPRRDWPFKRAFMVPLMRATVESLFAVGFPAVLDPADVHPTPKDIERGFVQLAPVEAELIKGEIKAMAELNSVHPKATYGYWYKAKGVARRGDHTAQDGELVILNFHGGGYCVETPSPSGLSAPGVCVGLLAHCTPRVTRVFSSAYRLVATAPFPPKNAFPAALFDALAAYRYLVHTLGFRPQNIVVAGDSAGGHLAIALTRYLASAEIAVLPPPGALLLTSPAVEWAVTHDREGGSWRGNQNTDIATPFFETEYTARGLAGNLPSDAGRTNAWISPASTALPEAEGHFKGFPKTFVIVGGAETQRDGICTFRDRLVVDIGEDKVRYAEIEGATHDVIGVPWYDEHTEVAFRTIGDWVATL